MSFSPREKRAIAYVARQNGWKLTLQSGKPSVFFLDQNGQTIKEDMKSVLSWYDQGRKADARERRAAKVAQNDSSGGYSVTR